MTTKEGKSFRPMTKEEKIKREPKNCRKYSNSNATKALTVNPSHHTIHTHTYALPLVSGDEELDPPDEFLFLFLKSDGKQFRLTIFCVLFIYLLFIIGGELSMFGFYDAWPLRWV